MAASEPSGHFVTRRGAILLLIAMLVGTGAGVLAWLAAGSIPGAVLVGGGAFAGTIPLLDRYVE
ncbi:hypothetical protein AB0F88_44170 [Streptosporangium sp. NPDC023963]|uniref:hypothetical protein n=1 Tax=Streptosporangium sp. NPDC023963 TaxID=3155608 RepID=UPI0034246235